MTYFNVKSLILAAAIIFNLLPNCITAQAIRPNSDFDNTWLLKNYYERLTKSDSICNAMNYSDFEIRIIYLKAKENILNIGSLIEGNRESFIIKNPNELYIAKSAFFRNPFTLSLKTRGSKTFLGLYEIKDSNKDSIIYVSLPKEYDTSDGFEHFINDKAFTGTYTSEDQKLRLKFFRNGKIEGFEDYGHYVVHHFTYSLNPFDIVTFQRKEANKIKKHKSFHWKKTGREIWLYNLSDETPVAEITTLFAKLKKVD